MTHSPDTISPDTINLCLEMLSTVSVPITLPDAEAKMKSFVTGRQELLTALATTGLRAGFSPAEFS